MLDCQCFELCQFMQLCRVYTFALALCFVIIAVVHYYRSSLRLYSYQRQQLLKLAFGADILAVLVVNIKRWQWQLWDYLEHHGILA